jgi:hypothetical protein
MYARTHTHTGCILSVVRHLFRGEVSSVCSGTASMSYKSVAKKLVYEGESKIIRNAVAFVCLLAALSFSRSSLGALSFLSLLHKFQVARSVPLLQT